MNLWEKILSLSKLPECNSIKDHLCSAEIGFSMYSNYKVEYVLPITEMSYVSPNDIGVSYTPNNVIRVSYVNPINEIQYVPPKSINIDYEC